MERGEVSEDLAGWRAQVSAPDRDAAALRDLLARLKAWQARHDQDRARQPGPFLQMAWDLVFADDGAEVAEAIRQVEEALAGS